MDTIEQFYQWNERQFAIGELSTSYLENPWDKHSVEYLKTNPTQSINAMEIYPSPCSGGPISSWGCISHSPTRELLPNHMEGFHPKDIPKLLGNRVHS